MEASKESIVGIRLTNESREILTEKAKSKHLKLATYLRQQILNDIDK